MNIANANSEIRFGSIVSAALLRLSAFGPIPAVSLHGGKWHDVPIPDSSTAANIRQGLPRGQFRVLVCRLPF
jgi:hypothetical protein